MKKIIGVYLLLFSTFGFSQATGFGSEWNGTTWLGGLPGNGTDVLISGNYNTSNNGNFTCRNLTITTGSLLIASGDYVDVRVKILSSNTSNFIIESGGNLLQSIDNGNNNNNIGSITVKRTATIRNLDYVYWSSPVFGFNNINITSPSNGSNLYKWIPTVVGNGVGNHGTWVAGSEIMSVGRGYIKRGMTSSVTPINFTTSFTGIPNNGNVDVDIYSGTYNGIDYLGNSSTYSTKNDDNWNLIGNPYPSGLSADKFLIENSNINGFIKIWSHGTLPSSSNPNPFYGTYAINYTINDYISYNLIGASSGPNTFDGKIASGQGFFVLMNNGVTSSTVSFKNPMRNTNNSNFYRTSSSDDGRVWLDLYKVSTISASNEGPKILIGYKNGATDNIDRLYDAITENKTGSNFYSISDNKPLIIQGRKSFTKDDVVLIGLKTISSGDYSITISDKDGILDNQTIYIKDNLLNITHDLSTPYQFSSEVGVFDNRFELRYEKTLSSDSFTNDSTIIYSYNNTINVKSDKHIKSIEVYDISGRLIKDEKSLNINEKSIDIQNNGIFIVKVTLEGNIIITKKVSN